MSRILIEPQHQISAGVNGGGGGADNGRFAEVLQAFARNVSDGIVLSFLFIFSENQILFFYLGVKPMNKY